MSARGYGHSVRSRKPASSWRIGRVALAEALRPGAVQIEGKRALVRAFPSFLQLSIFAGNAAGEESAAARAA